MRTLGQLDNNTITRNDHGQWTFILAKKLALRSLAG
jgi:hypothetical protein